MSESQDGTFGVKVYDGDGEYVDIVRAPSRTMANRLRKVLRAWDGPRDGDTLLDLCYWALHAGSGWWYKTVIKQYELGWRYRDGEYVKPE